MIYAGIDPGWSTGGVALLKGSWAEVHDMPVFHKSGVDTEQLMDILRSVEIQLCVVEKQSTRPGQGIVSAGKIMFAYGQILTCLIATKTPHRIVTPAKWKRDAAVPSDKDGARRMAQQLYPSVSARLRHKKDEHRAEALLMAAYAEALG